VTHDRAVDEELGSTDRPARPTPTRTRLRRRSFDPFLLLVPVVAAVTYALHGFDGSLTRDLALYTYAGQQTADGVPPYEGVLNRAGPLAHAIPGVGVLLARLLGTDDVVTTRVLFLLIATACTTAVYLLGRDLFRQRAPGLVAAAVFLGWHGFIQYAADGPREKTPMVLFITLALWAMTHRRWFTAGVCTSLATLCLQIALFPTLAAVAVAALATSAGWRGRAASLARIALGGALPVAACTVWFAMAGSLRQSVDAFLLINARYTTANPPLSEFATVRADALSAYGPVWICLLGLGVALLWVQTVAALVPAVRRREPTVVLLAALGVGVAVGLVWDLRDYDSWADLFPLLPFASVGVASVVPLLGRVARTQVVRIVALVAAGVAVVASVHWSTTTGNDVLDEQRQATRAVFGALPADATLTSIEAPIPLVLTGRTNPTEHQMFRAGLQDYVDDTWPGGLDGFARDLVDQRPTLIAMGTTTYNYWRDAIGPDYVCVGAAPGWSWWADRDLAPGTIEALRTATGYRSPSDCARKGAITSLR
jgi:hypothetical protein